ncbi:hypothetical protein [Tuwongella immobilis]|uniref:Uncharacterized protein n=1 Tax=Tuwongella immobilis TaxID=692036 RepID=A0A6C2YKF7_9BACT|nr:hypothetical protein [Tuwongella immobilis]VIP01593.1 unnamed protein product [Tuwongella immobilis]VTR98868.1 unnamed protein product [Tuwongella immobilis]
MKATLFLLTSTFMSADAHVAPVAPAPVIVASSECTTCGGCETDPCAAPEKKKGLFARLFSKKKKEETCDPCAAPAPAPCTTCAPAPAPVPCTTCAPAPAPAPCTTCAPAPAPAPVCGCETVCDPCATVEAEKKPGLFSRLFGRKSKAKAEEVIYAPAVAAPCTNCAPAHAAPVHAAPAAPAAPAPAPLPMTAPKTTSATTIPSATPVNLGSINPF